MEIFDMSEQFCPPVERPGIRTAFPFAAECGPVLPVIDLAPDQKTEWLCSQTLPDCNLHVCRELAQVGP